MEVVFWAPLLSAELEMRGGRSPKMMSVLGTWGAARHVWEKEARGLKAPAMGQSDLQWTKRGSRSNCARVAHGYTCGCTWWQWGWCCSIKGSQVKVEKPPRQSRMSTEWATQSVVFELEPEQDS